MDTSRASKLARHIVVMGGGGFSGLSKDAAPSASLLDDYILSLTKARKPRVCFVPTASGDSPTYIDKFHAAFPASRAKTSVLKLFQRDTTSPADLLLAQDVIYVGGGNVANLLAIWRLHGVDKAMRAAFKKGVVLCGVSAGMNCWFEACSTDSFGPLFPLKDGLGLIKGAACPHFDGEAARKPSLLKWVASGKLPTTYAADDNAALHFTATGNSSVATLHACVKSHLQAGCYRVSAIGRKPHIESLPTLLLK